MGAKQPLAPPTAPAVDPGDGLSAVGAEAAEPVEEAVHLAAVPESISGQLSPQAKREAERLQANEETGQERQGGPEQDRHSLQEAFVGHSGDAVQDNGECASSMGTEAIGVDARQVEVFCAASECQQRSVVFTDRTRAECSGRLVGDQSHDVPQEASCERLVGVPQGQVDSVPAVFPEVALRAEERPPGVAPVDDPWRDGPAQSASLEFPQELGGEVLSPGVFENEGEILPDASQEIAGHAAREEEHSLGERDACEESAQEVAQKTAAASCVPTRELSTQEERSAEAAKRDERSEALTCVVCLDEVQPHERRSHAKHAGCVHVFHWDCIKRWLTVKATCPVCNAALFDRGVYEVDPVSGTETLHRIRPEGGHGSLHTAAAEGDLNEIHRLLASGATVNRTTIGAVTPLHVAAHNGHIDAIAQLLSGGAHVNQAAAGGATPLYIATQNRHSDSVARLLAGGAHPNQATEGGGAPLHVASQLGHAESVAWLLAGGANVDQAMEGGTTPLFLAAQSGHTDVIMRLLAQSASVNQAAEDGATPMHYAALHGHTEAVARLLVGGADVNRSTVGGGTPLHIAAQGGHTETVAWLLAGKAEVNREMAGGVTPLYLAAGRGHAEVMAWLLAKGASVDHAAETGATPLYIASHGGHEEAVSRLLAGGAAGDRKAVGGTTPLHAAVVGCHTEVLGRLLVGGAVPKPEDVWVSLVLGNVRGARRLAKATGYSWSLIKSGILLLAGVLAICISSSVLCAVAARRTLGPRVQLLPEFGPHLPADLDLVFPEFGPHLPPEFGPHLLPEFGPHLPLDFWPHLLPELGPHLSS